MSFLRSDPHGRHRLDPLARAGEHQVEQRRSLRPGHVCSGTLACRRCDAPIAAGEAGLALTDELHCPYCHHHAPVRDFLSLEVPNRPARVVVRVTLPGM